MKSALFVENGNRPRGSKGDGWMSMYAEIDWFISVRLKARRLLCRSYSYYLPSS
jgi:hypothetical protein